MVMDSIDGMGNNFSAGTPLPLQLIGTFEQDRLPLALDIIDIPEQKTRRATRGLFSRILHRSADIDARLKTLGGCVRQLLQQTVSENTLP